MICKKTARVKRALKYDLPDINSLIDCSHPNPGGPVYRVSLGIIVRSSYSMIPLAGAGKEISPFIGTGTENHLTVWG